MIKFILLFVLTFITILFFDKLEVGLLNFGFSWTLSKATPYILTIILGVLLSLNLFKKIKINRVLKLLIVFALLITPFIINFVLHPIYEGDFSKNGKELPINIYNETKLENGLMVITIPNCPYCYLSINQLKKIKQRNTNINIEYKVCSSDTSKIKTYQEEVKGKFKVQNASNPDSLASVADFKFPAFVLIKNGKPIYKWSNDEFGVRAIDLLESSIENTK